MNEQTNHIKLDTKTRELLRVKAAYAINNAIIAEVKAVRTLQSWGEAREGLNRALNIWND